jgi:ABC-2 type transport system permease protein
MMKRTSLLTLYRHNIRNEIARAMQFRADFAIGVFSSLLFTFMSVFLQFLLFRLTRGYPGWTIEQMLLFQGVFMLWTGIRSTFFGGVRELMARIMWRGEFDQILLKPFHTGGYLLVSGFDFTQLGSIVAGIVVIALALPATGAVITVWNLLACAGFLVAGIVLYLALTLFFCSLSLVIINSSRFIDLMERMLDFSSFPADVYSPAARMVYEVAAPFAVFICFPAQALLGRYDLAMAGGAVVAIVFFFSSLLVWNMTIRRYTSAGG